MKDNLPLSHHPKKCYFHIIKLFKTCCYDTSNVNCREKVTSPTMNYIFCIKLLLTVTCPDDEKTETTTKKDEPVTEKPDNKTDKSPNDVTTVKLVDTTSPSSGETKSTSDPNNETDPTETPSLRNFKKKKNVSFTNIT